MELFAVVIVVFVISSIYSFFASRKAVKQRRIDLEKTFGQAPSYRTDLTSVDAYWAQFMAEHKDLQPVDDITWNDLDMDEVFHRINVCQTSVGEENLYKTLRLAKGVPEEYESWLAALRSNKEDRLNCQTYLTQLGRADHNGLAAFLSGANRVNTLSAWLLTILGFLPVAGLVSMLFIGFTGLLIALAAAIFNLVYAVYFKQKVSASLSGMRYLSRMLWCTGKLSQIKIKGLEGVLDPIKELHKVFRPIKSKVSALTAENMNYSNADMMGEFVQMFLLSDPRAYAKSANLILKNKEKAWELYEMVGLLDTLITVVSFRKSLGAVCKPTYHDDMSVEMERMGHPLLIRPIENTCELKRDTLITGSNASGKSTFIKAVAVNALLAQAINTCAAKTFKMPHALVISSMALKDSIVKGDSYFVAEIKSLRRIMEQSKTRPCLCFVDEILRGTNTIERIAASAAVLYSLSQANCLCLVASHDIELTRILENEFDNYHFSETVSDAGVTFDYLLKPGPSKTRNAIVLLSTMGFDERIIQQAHSLVKTFEDTNAWPTFTKGEPLNAPSQS